MRRRNDRLGRYETFGGSLNLFVWLFFFRNPRRLIVAGGICAAVATVVLAILLSMMFWEWLSGGESGGTTIRNIALVAAGLIAFPLAIWRGVVANRQANTAQQGLLNDRYQKGAEMLGSEVLSVRLGGIYALRRLAEEWPDQYYVQIMRLFCAFARLPTRDQSLVSGPAAIEPGTLSGIRQDVAAVMQMIGSRDRTRIALERTAGFMLDLRGADLSAAEFLEADLSNALFHNAKLSGANFVNTNLSDSFLSCSDLSRAQLHNVNFTGTRLWSANLSGALLQDAELPGTNFHNANLSGTNLLGANLSGAIFQDAIASGALLERANLSGAGFLRADLSGARLVMADMSGAHFLEADLTGANISKTNLSGVAFSVGGRQTARGLTQAQLDDACADPQNPPELVGALDAGSGEPLVWREKPINGEDWELSEPVRGDVA